jgi:hypothetical protein
MNVDDSLCAEMQRWLAQPPPQACHLDKLGAGSEQGRRDKAPQEPYWPYPWPEDEMVSRYGLRRLTETEAKAFPGIPLALRVFKARITRPPGVLPKAKGWVVWLAETYPGCFLVNLPGAGTLIADYHDIRWTAVPDETPVTTAAMVRAEDERLRLEAAKWRPGQVVTTPGTRLSWDCLAAWFDGWWKLNRRAHSSDRYWKEKEHIRALPLEMIAAEGEPAILYDFLTVMNSNAARPPKGLRAGHPANALVQAAHNRLAQLDAPTFRQVQLQQSLQQALSAAAADSRAARPSSEKDNLSLF